MGFLQFDAEKQAIFDEGDTLREKNKNGGRTKKKCVGSSVRCWLNLSIEERISVIIPVMFKAYI